VSGLLGAWVNGRVADTVDVRDRGLQYGDGVFETMRVRDGAIRLLDFHLERLHEGCRRLAIAAPNERRLRHELARIAGRRRAAVLKLIVTRGTGTRGYRPSGRERGTRVISLHALPSRSLQAAERSVRVRLCATRLGINETLSGLKTLNRLESVMARAEWTDARVWEGLMQDTDGNIVSGTMSNVFVRQGSFLMTPMLDRCGIAGVMRRWVLSQANTLKLRAIEGRLRLDDMARSEEVFMTNAVAGVVSVAAIEHGRDRIRPVADDMARLLRGRLERI
jgi:4-amino-4-deoxychorismate lyase